MGNIVLNHSKLMFFFITCLISYILGGLCLSQFKFLVQSIPQTVYLVILVGLFFIYGIIFLFM
ncbi:hypothetical protein AXK70_18430, partial [Salmonella enterica subsp. enterica]|nr:hypothetical protein [Salmonella enterica subsp. enterica]